MSDRDDDIGAVRIGDEVRFQRAGVTWRGTVMDIRPHINAPDVRFAFVAVLGWPEMFVHDIATLVQVGDLSPRHSAIGSVQWAMR